MNNQTRNSRRLEYGPTSPVESHRGERAGIIIDVVVPILQAFTVGILTACVVVAFVNLIYNSGEFPFWVGSGVVSFAAFLWILKVQYSMGVEILDLITAFLMALLAGFFCWAFARVATWARRSWLSMWTFGAFVFLLSFFLHLELTLLQRLGQPWQFQRQAIWGAVRTLAEYWGKRERKKSRLGPIAHTGRETKQDHHHTVRQLRKQ